MASMFTPNVLTFKCDSAISKGMCLKPGTDKDHVVKSAAATSKNYGIALNDTTTAEDKVEVAVPGGGAKALLGGTAAVGDLLTSDSSGYLVVTTTPGDRYIAVCMEDGVVGDLVGVMVQAGLI